MKKAPVAGPRDERTGGEMGEEMFTTGTLLGGRLVFRQPRHGYRVAIDPLFLAAAIEGRGGRPFRALELGIGSGAASLALAWRLPEATIVGTEIQPDLAALARDNICLNGMEGRISVSEVDVVDGALVANMAGVFDEVFFNPPYLDPARTTPPDRAAPGGAQRYTAHVLGPGGIAAWLEAAAPALVPGGGASLILPGSVLAEGVALFAAHFGDVTVYPLFPRPGAAATRVILRGRKGAAGGRRELTGLVLHDPAGGYTAAAERVLRGGAGLALSPSTASL